MRVVGLLGILSIISLAGCTSGKGLVAPETFDANQIEAAERLVATALAAADVTAWVSEYAEEAVLLASGEPSVAGRAAEFDGHARRAPPSWSGALRSFRPRPFQEGIDRREECVGYLDIREVSDSLQ
jgi:hypothetical protein